VVTHDPLEAADLYSKAVVIEGGHLKEKGPLKTCSTILHRQF
jgi:ABC-type sulfate/molybdate transport systems ATPase subunit